MGKVNVMGIVALKYLQQFFLLGCLLILFICFLSLHPFPPFSPEVQSLRKEIQILLEANK